MKLYRVAIEGLHENIYIAIKDNQIANSGDKFLIVSKNNYYPSVGTLVELANTNEVKPEIYGVGIYRIKEELSSSESYDLTEMVGDYNYHLSVAKDLLAEIENYKDYVYIYNNYRLPKELEYRNNDDFYTLLCSQSRASRLSKEVYAVKVPKGEKVATDDILIAKGMPYVLYNTLDKGDDDNLNVIELDNNRVDIIIRKYIESNKELLNNLNKLCDNLSHEFYNLFK